MGFKRSHVKYCLAAMMAGCVIWFYITNQITTSYENEIRTINFILNTKGCRLPYMDPFDLSIRRYLSSEKPIICDENGKGMLVNTMENLLYVNITVSYAYGLTRETLFCCYRPFRFLRLDYNSRTATIRFLSKYKPFTVVRLKHEFIHVRCTLPENTTYEDYFSFVQKRNINLPKDDSKVNVLMIGLDSVSRLNFHRQMPKSLKLLKKLKAVEMFGFNKVGDNTYPNVVAMLAGMTSIELEILCIKNNMNATGFEKCPMIWKKYKNNGYMTGFGEDLGYSSIFGYNDLPGFAEKPTDYYFNELGFGAFVDNFHKRMLVYPLCFGKRLLFEVFTDAVKQFAINLKDIPTFGFFWSSSLSHDNVNLLRFADDYIYSLLKSLDDNGIFNSSIVILISDHGMRSGTIRETYQGYMEEKLPLLYFKYPKWFPSKYSKAVKNLKANAHRLISSYDIYKTLVDLIDLNSISNGELDNRVHNKEKTLGKSLFLPIDETRNCNDAGIPESYCTCRESVATSINSEIVNDSAIEMVVQLNKMLKNYTQCSSLYIKRILSAFVERTNPDLAKYFTGSIEDYRITFEAWPSLAHFEGTVRYRPLKRSYQLVSPINRINLYGNQSACVQDAFLKLYCYCDS